METSGCSRVYMDRGENVTCTISLFGGCITSWKIDNVEQLFVSKTAILDNLGAIRGGIMMIFPHYRAWALGPSDGFANMMTWKVAEEPHQLETGDIRVVLELTQCRVSDNIWNYDYTLRYQITLLDKELHLKLSVKNQSKCSFYFNLLFSTHLKVPNVENCSIYGLKGTMTRDLKNKSLERKIWMEDVVNFTEEIYTAFLETGSKLTVSNVMRDKEMFLTKKNLPDVIVYNPWMEHGRLREGWLDDEWNQMVAIEAGHYRRPIVLEIGEEIEVMLDLSVKGDLEREGEIIRFY